MWFLPILVVGAIAMALAKRSARKALPTSRQLSAGPPIARPATASWNAPRPVLAGAPGRPGPISVLGEILRIGQTPPPTVILCAIAEAQSIGRNDLVSDIVKVFIAPVVYRHQQQQRSRGASPGPISYQPGPINYQRGSCAAARSPRYDAEAYGTPGAPSHFAPPAPLPFTPPAPSPFEAGVYPPPQAVPRSEVSTSDAAAQPSMSSSMPSSMDDEISALLHADPVRFMEMVSRSGTFPLTVHAPQAPQAVPVPVAPPPPAPPPPPIAQPTELPSETVAQMQVVVGFADTEDQTHVMSPGSPIPGVSDPAWRDFVVRLERESPQLASQRHVGQYRQRRERLAELGIDPRAITGSAQAQRLALDADLADAHRHGAAGGLFAQHLGRPITMPGREGAERITLSGVLGVIQCAGLEGAVGWLERPTDRKRYPHTTQAFLTTNGVF